MVEPDLAAVSAAAHEYEHALAAGDGAAALAFFDDAPDTSRFGPEGAQLDLEAVARVRTASAPTPQPRGSRSPRVLSVPTRCCTWPSSNAAARR